MRTKWFAIAWPTKRGGLADPLLRASSEHFPKCAMREHGGLACRPVPPFVGRGSCNGRPAVGDRTR